MKTCTKNLFLLPGLIAGLGLIPAGRVTAQTFTTLYSFTAMSSDGANPETVLILSGNTLFGTASYGGISGNGTVFAVNTDGSGFTNLHSFTALNNSTNSDGATPYGGLILASNTLYGTAFYGGGSGKGAVFAVNTDGTDFTNLHSFTGGSDGANPFAGLILSAYTLYGTARGIFGGPDYGMVFAVNTDGSGFTNLHSFTAVNNYTNSDGANPFAGLILSGNTLYGTTFIGGSQGNGTVFAMNTDGTGFTNLHSLPGAANEGSNPQSRLVLSNNTLYGTTQVGGSSIFGALCSRSTLMARVLRTCIISRVAATELIRLPDWFYRAVPCMGRRLMAAIRAMARCSPSTPMARVLRTCIISRVVATELIRMPV